jgi:hypothetical protein
VAVAVGIGSVGGRAVDVGNVTGTVAAGAGDAQPTIKLIRNTTRSIERKLGNIVFSFEKQYFYD